MGVKCGSQDLVHRNILPSLAIHAGNTCPGVRFWVVNLHSAQPGLTIISSNGIKQAVHNCYTYSTSWRFHWLTSFPAISNGVKHFNYIQWITWVKKKTIFNAKQAKSVIYQPSIFNSCFKVGDVYLGTYIVPYIWCICLKTWLNIIMNLGRCPIANKMYYFNITKELEILFPVPR